MRPYSHSKCRSRFKAWPILSLDRLRFVLVTAGLAACLTGCGGGGEAPSSRADEAPAGSAKLRSGAGVTSGGSVPNPTSVERPSGVFVLTTRRLGEQEKIALISQPGIAGMTSYVTWADLEPQLGALDTSRLDADIAIARVAGKKITIGVFTGKNALPGWLESQGVRTWTTTAGDRLAHPSDSKFVQLWSERVAELGRRYDKDPTVVQVTICGAAGTLCGPRYPEVPGDFDFQQTLSNWSSLIMVYAAAFPKTQLNLEVHLTRGYAADLPSTLFSTLQADMKVGLFAEFLSDMNPQPGSPVGQVFASRVPIDRFCGFQMVGVLGERLSKAIELGRSYGCSYFEVYSDDVRDGGVLGL